MRRMSFKARKGKAASNDNSEEPDTQDNGNAAPEGSEEEESASEEVKSESPRKKSKRGKKNEVKTDDDEGSSMSSDEDSKSSKKKAKRNKKGNDREAETEQKRKRSTKIETPVKDNESDEEEMEQEYEVEQVVDFKVVDGVRQFKIRWRGYSEKGDTWEQEEDLNCKDLIDGYFENHPESEKVSKKSSKGSKKHKKQKNNVEPKAKKRKAEVEPIAEEDGEKIYEVDRVLEVHFKKNGRREFLIRWKGFSGQDDTWEPEENLNCPDLIEKFMKKVNEAKSLSARELRANPQTTDRFILTADQKGRRLSPRYRGRSRQTYYNVE